MADTVAIVFDQRNALAGQLAASPFGGMSGTITISSYSQTKVAYAALTGKFKSLKRCIIDGISSNGYLCRWDTATNTVRAYIPGGTVTATGTNSAPIITTTTGNPATAPIGVITGALAQTAGATGITGVQAPVFTGSSATVAGAAGVEVANATNVGVVNFFAIGQLG